MIVYPNTKINLGLHIVSKRSDGYHNIETVFYPVGWTDILELVRDDEREAGVGLSMSGIEIPGDVNDNLCVRAYELISHDYPMPAVKVHLHKMVPTGAGLGGGSADAAFFIRALNELFELNLAWGELHHYAKQLGADCSFFITNKPCLAVGKGDELESIQVDLSAYQIVIVHPGIHVSTAQAYGGVQPMIPSVSLEEIVTNIPVVDWKNVLVNDFEKSVFSKFPGIASVKEKMYEAGAVYSAMSGSGSAVFGLFTETVDPKIIFPGMKSWSSR